MSFDWGACTGGTIAALSGFIVVWRQTSADRNEKTTLVRLQLQYVLERIRDIGGTATSLVGPITSRPDLLEEIIAVRRIYERVSNYGMFLPSADYHKRAQTFIMEAAIAAERIWTTQRLVVGLSLQTGDKSHFTTPAKHEARR